MKKNLKEKTPTDDMIKVWLEEKVKNGIWFHIHKPTLNNYRGTE